MRLYLSGPMAGIPEFNYPAFAEARERLRKAEYDVYDPSEGIEPDGSVVNVQRLMKGHISQVVESEAIVLLPGYARSEGSKVELAAALAIGLPVYLYRKSRPFPLEPFPQIRVVTRCEALSGG